MPPPPNLNLLRTLDVLLDNPKLTAAAAILGVTQSTARSTPLAWKRLPFAAPSYRYWLLWHAHHHHDDGHRWFRALVHQALNQFDQGD